MLFNVEKVNNLMLKRLTPSCNTGKDVKCTCMGTVFCMTLLARKQSEVRLRKNAGALLKTVRFKTYCPYRQKCFNSSERCSF